QKKEHGREGDCNHCQGPIDAAGDIQKCGKAQERAEHRQHALNKDVLNGRCIMLYAISNFVRAALVMKLQAHALHMPEKKGTEVKYELFTGVGLQQPCDE